MPFISSVRGSYGANGRFNRPPTPPALYLFSSATFTPGGASGRNGPNITQARNGVGNPAWAPTYLNMTTNGIQRWTVAQTGSYRITCRGARGGNASTPGAGAVILGTFSLTASTVLNILVGQEGNQSGVSGSKGGGGGSFVWNDSNTLLIAAGGGGGAQASNAGVNGQAGTSGTTQSDGTGTPGTSGNGTQNAAGWSTDGTAGPTDGGGATRPLAGGLGSIGYNDTAEHKGGFGGGGGGGGSPSTTNGSGGGGGYSGGAGGGVMSGGGGGGSFNSGTNQTNTTGGNAANGSILIEKL